MDLFETIADRRIREARAEGLFDNLEGHGKPIADLHLQREPGWWSSRVVQNERHKMQAEELEAWLRKAMPALWRLGDERELRSKIGEMNQWIADYNRVTTLVPKKLMSVEETVAIWREPFGFHSAAKHCTESVERF